MSKKVSLARAFIVPLISGSFVLYLSDILTETRVINLGQNLFLPVIFIFPLVTYIWSSRIMMRELPKDLPPGPHRSFSSSDIILMLIGFVVVSTALYLFITKFLFA